MSEIVTVNIGPYDTMGFTGDMQLDEARSENLSLKKKLAEAASHITALEARVRELERALTEIEKRDRFYTNRKYINAATIVVEDRGRYNVLVLGDLGKIARAALNQEKQK